MAAGLVPSPAIEQAVAAAAANSTLSITHSPVGGTFAKGNSVYLYSQAFSTAKNLLSYQWYRNTSNSTDGGTAIDGATSANLVDESHPAAGTYYYYAKVTDTKTGEVAKTNAAKVTLIDKTLHTALQNGGFEEGKKGLVAYPEYYTAPWWRSTDSGGKGDTVIAENGYYINTITPAIFEVPKYEGELITEIACNNQSSIFQEIAAAPGSVFSWSLAHIARKAVAPEKMALIIGAAKADDTLQMTADMSNFNTSGSYGTNYNDYFHQIFSALMAQEGETATSIPDGSYQVDFGGNSYDIWVITDGKAWKKHEGFYTVPEGQGISAFGFVSVIGAENSTTSANGNLLDAISFQQGESIAASSDVDAQGNGILSATSQEGYAYGILEVRGSTVTQVSNFQAKKGDVVLAEDATVTAAGGQGWYVPGAGTINFTNLTPGKTYRIVQAPVGAIGGVMGQNKTPASVLDENCYDDFAVKPVSGGSGSAVGNIQVTARNETDGTSSLIVDPARDDVEYGVVAANAAGDGPADPVKVVKEWASSDTGRLVIAGLQPDTAYIVVGRPKGYTEIEYGPASASGTVIKTPSPAFKDVLVADVTRSEDGETLTVKNNAVADQEYMVYDVETKVPTPDGWYSIAKGASHPFAVTSNRQYQVVTRSAGAVPAPGLRSYPAPLETVAVDFVNEVIPKGSTMPKSLQYRAQDKNNGQTWRYGTANSWLTGSGGANVSLTAALDDMSALEEQASEESKGATFWYRTAPDYDPSVAMEKALSVPARPEAPAQGAASAHAGKDFWIDYATDQLKVGSKAVQFRSAGASSWTLYAADSSINLPLVGWSEKGEFAFELRLAAIDTGTAETSAFASEPTSATVPQRAEGPTTAGDPEVKGSKDGENLHLENVTAAMEYREWGTDGAWTRITEDQLKTAADGKTRYVDVTKDGTYEVRAAATDDAPASFSVTASTTDSALSIKTLVRSFEQQNWGYDPAPTQSIDIKNTGTADAVITGVALGGGASSNFVVNGDATGTVKAGTEDKTRAVSPVKGLAPGVYDDTVVVTYRSITGDTQYTAAVPVYVQVRQAHQDQPRDVAATVTDNTLTVSAKVPVGYALTDPLMEFSIDGGIDWTPPASAVGTGDERAATCLFSGLNAATCYTVLARMAADDNNYKLVSDEAVAKFYTAKAAPAASKMIIDFVKETASYPTGHEAASQAAGGGDSIARGGSITNYLGAEATTFSLRQTAGKDASNLDIPASAWTDVSIPARPAAPTDVKPTNADSSKVSNGTITVTGATSVEYRKAGDTAWIPGSGTITGLAAGVYEVRLAATSAAFASLPATAEVKAEKEVFATFMKNNGATGDDAVFDTQTVVPGNAVSAPAAVPSRANYEFAGWYESADGGASLAENAFNFATKLTADITLYAKWTANSYSLTFDTAGGSAAPTGQKVSYDGKATAPAEPTRAGYTFAGWALSGRAAENTVVFDFDKTLAQNFTDADATPPQNDAEVVLVAQWIALSYGVSFDAGTGNAADNPTAPGSIAFDAWVTASKAAPTPEPTREGYAFAGWRLVKADGTVTADNYQFAKTLGQNLEAASLVPDDPAVPVVIKASWSERTYGLSFDPAGGAPGSVAQQDVKYTAKASEPAAVKRAGYAFDGWRLVTGTVDGTPQLSAVSFDFSKSLADNLEAAGVSAPGAGEELKLSFAAAWTASKYTVLFDADADGVGDEGETAVADVAFDSAVPGASSVATPERAGWTFSHWKIADAEDAKAFDPAATLTANFTAAGLVPAESAVQVVLVPVFTANSYTLFFDADANGVCDTQKGDSRIESISYDQAITATEGVAVPQKTGYDFAAWHLVDAEGNTLSAAFALDATLQANFEAAGATPPITSGSDVRLVPSFEARSYVLAADLNGDGEIGSDEPSATGALFNEVVSKHLSQPIDGSRAGYSFDGWAIKGATGNAHFSFDLTLEANCTAASFDPGAAGSTVIVERVWIPKSYKIAFDAAGGTPTPAGPADPALFNGTVVSPSQDSERAGYAFAGWRLRTGGEDGAPTLSDVDYNFALTLEANFRAAGFDMDDALTPAPDVPADGSTITLYAAWDPNTYTLLFDADADGAADAGEATASITSDGTAAAPANPVRVGYTFAGTWHVAGRAEGSTAAFDFSLSLIDNLTAAGFDTAATGSGLDVPADGATIALVPDWTENSYTLSFVANPTDDPDDPSGTYPPDDLVIANPSDAGPVTFEADASKVVMPQVECTGYKFAGWRFSDASDETARYDTTKSFKENLAAAGFDTTGAGATAPQVPANDATIKLQAVWTQIPISVAVPTTLTAQIGFDVQNPDVRTVTVNPDPDPDDGVPAPEPTIVSRTEAPLQVTGVTVDAGADLSMLFPEGLHKGIDAVTMSLNGAAVFDGKTLAQDGASTLFPQATKLPATNAFKLGAFSGSGSPSALPCEFSMSAPMAIPMAQITDPLSAASFLKIGYTFAIVPETTSTGGE